MSTHAPHNYICPFCQIARANYTNPPIYTQAGDIIYRDALVTAFIGSHQWPDAQPNVLVIPNQHAENLYSLPPRLMRPVQELSQAVARALKETFDCPGVSTRQHNEPAGNQDVWHYHQHVTARYTSDNLYATLTTNRLHMPVETRAAYAHPLRALLDRWHPTYLLNFRDFQPADQPAVRRLVLEGLGQRFGHVEEKYNPDLDNIQQNYTYQGDLFVVLERKGSIVGCGALIKEEGQPDIGRIVRVSVAHTHQGQGLGYAISQHLIERAYQRQVRRLLVETNADWDSALRLYRRCGFREYARTKAEGFDFVEVHMALDL